MLPGLASGPQPGCHLCGSRLPSSETRDRPGERLGHRRLAVGGARVAAQQAVGGLGVGELLGDRVRVRVRGGVRVRVRVKVKR
eukprot:scaffold103037_cov84-Phaeocystis_antarctica.AAC.3